MSAGSQSPSGWKRLFRIAHSLIEQVNQAHGNAVIERWTFGGGTAVMLQIGHRESHDVDIFLEDPQYLAYLNPATGDFEFEAHPSDYKGDGSRFLKLAFEEVGEIDFIAAPSLTEPPTIKQEVEGIQTLLETVPEVITKKVFYRGRNIQPRDIFDLAAAAATCRDEVQSALAQYPDEVRATLAKMEQLNPVFIEDVISELEVMDGFKAVAASAPREAKRLLEAVVRQSE